MEAITEFKTSPSDSVSSELEKLSASARVAGKTLLELATKQTPMLNHEQDLDWQADAKCKGADPDLFFPDRGGEIEAPKQVCQGCPVQNECLEYAIVNTEKFGIWGGTSERERRRIRKARNAAQRARANG